MSTRGLPCAAISNACAEQPASTMSMAMVIISFTRLKIQERQAANDTGNRQESTSPFCLSQFREIFISRQNYHEMCRQKIKLSLGRMGGRRKMFREISNLESYSAAHEAHACGLARLHCRPRPGPVQCRDQSGFELAGRF